MNIAKTLMGSAALLAVGAGAAYLFVNTDNRGVPSLYGDDPLKIVPAGNAKYYRVVYLKFAGTANEPSLTARHAVFSPKTGNDDDVAGAAEILQAGRPIAGKPQPVGGTVYSNFEHFGFRSRQRIYVIVDNDRVGFQKATPISFTPYGANEPIAYGNTDRDAHKPRPTTRDKNNSFYNVAFFTITLGTKTREVLKFDNILKASDGSQIPPTTGGPAVERAKFSINFNLNMCAPLQNPCVLTNPRHIIPLVIDPDTGNGMGAPPPD